MNYLLILALVLVLSSVATPLRAEQGDGVHTPVKASGTAEKPAMGEKKAPAFDDTQALQISQAAIGQTVGGFSLLDREDRKVELEDYRGKPLVVSFIYTACFHTCPIITQSIKRAARVARDTFGDDSFQMLTIGFDTRRDSPDKMRIYARQQGVADEASWKFLSADKKTMARLVEKFGFIYFKTVSGFEHLSQTTVIDAKGVIRHQIYGESFETPQFVEPIKQLIFGGSSDLSLFTNLVNKAKLWCTLYDPRTDSYRFQYSMLVGFGISITFLICFGILLIRMWKKVLRYRRTAPTTTIDDD
jgi:protein SCO1/2